MSPLNRGGVTVRRLLDREAWEGPVGIARIVGLLSATWLLIAGFLMFIDMGGMTPAKLLLPSSIMLVALAFIAGYQMGQSRRQ
jgi:hypothetical protein